jgi:predicted MFS family arabinose efflux permease
MGPSALPLGAPAGAQGAGHRAALIGLGVAGVSVFLAMPVIAAALAGELGYSQREVGIFSTVQLAGISIGCLLSVLAPRADMRRMGVGALLVLAACDVLSLWAPSREAFLLLRFVGGCAGGIAVSRATGGLARLPRSEREFGYFLAVQTGVAIMAVYALPPLVGRFGIGACFLPLVAVEGLAFALVCRFLPTQHAVAPATADRERNDAAGWTASSLMLAAILAFYVGVGALWTYLAAIGQGIGLTPGQIAFAISFSKIVAFVASFLPGALGVRFGRVGPMTICAVVLIAATQMFAAGATPGAFVAAAAAFSFGWYVLHPLHLAALAHLDRDGRPVLASAALTGAGLALGPALVAAAPGQGHGVIYAVAALAFATSGVLTAAALWWREGAARITARAAQ